MLLAASYSAHYRLGVWRALTASSLVRLDIAMAQTVPGGHESSIQPIAPDDLADMRVHRTYRLGAFRWQPGLLRQACSRRYDVVVWDPAYRSLAVWIGLGWTSRHGPVKEWAKVRAFRLAHGFLTYGHQSAERAVEAGYPRDRLYVVGKSMVDSVDAGRVVRAGLPPLSPLILGTSLRLTGRKRIDLLVRAASALQSSGTPCRVLVVG